MSIALVTGGNRGIGLAVVKGLAKHSGIKTVILTSTKEEDGKKAVADLKNEGLTNIGYHQLDTSNKESIDQLINDVLKEYGKVDILVNNAGVFKEWGAPFLQTNEDAVYSTFEINTMGPLRLSKGFLPKMVEQNYGRIVNMSSGAGQLSDMNGKHLAYRISKASLNVITKVISDEYKNQNILSNSMCPGYVKTDMTGGANSKATKTPEEAAETAVWLATLPEDGPRGGFFRDKKAIAW